MDLLLGSSRESGVVLVLEVPESWLLFSKHGLNYSSKDEEQLTRFLDHGNSKSGP